MGLSKFSWLAGRFEDRHPEVAVGINGVSLSYGEWHGNVDEPHM